MRPGVVLEALEGEVDALGGKEAQGFDEQAQVVGFAVGDGVVDAGGVDGGKRLLHCRQHACRRPFPPRRFLGGRVESAAHPEWDGLVGDAHLDFAAVVGEQVGNLLDEVGAEHHRAGDGGGIHSRTVDEAV